MGTAKAQTQRTCDSLANLTVVIPSYGRQDFLLRQAVYWKDSMASILLLDGSEKALDEDIKAKIAESGNITYVHRYVSFAERMRLGGSMIATSHAVMGGDDEFLLTSGLESALKKLERDPTAIGCMGQSLWFIGDEVSHSVSYSPGYPHWKYEVRAAKAAERLYKAMSKYVSATSYAVLKSDVWRRSWGQHGEWSSPYAGEIQQALTAYAWGNLTSVDEVFWMRSAENSPVNSLNYNRGLSFEEWWEAPRFRKEHDQFVSMIVYQLLDREAISPEQAVSVVETAIRTYIENLEGQSANSGLRSLFIGWVKKILPSKLIEQLKAMLFDFRSTPPAKGILGSLEELKAMPPQALKLNGTPLFFAELAQMESIVRAFHMARKEAAP
jgi:glycosyltransferase domain-containing protein